MESSNMYSRSSIQWLCVILVLAFIHGINCDPNSGCLRNGNTELHIDQCIGENGLEIVPRNIDGLLGKFNFMKVKDYKKCNDTSPRSVSIQFGQGCTIDLEVGLAGQNVYVNRPNDGVNINAHKLLLDKDGLKNDEENGKLESVVSCTPKLEAESKSLKLMFTEGKGTVPIKGCGYYLKFDDALVRHTTTTSTTTTATTTTTPSTLGLSTSHPTSPIDSSLASFNAWNWLWLVAGISVIILLLVVSSIVLIVWRKRRNASRKVPVEEGKVGKDINMVTARTVKEVEHKPWDRKKSDSSKDHPDPPSDPRDLDVGKGYENLQEFIENRPPAFAEGNATEVQKKTPVDEEQCQNLQQVIEGGPPAFGGGIATEVQKS